jgi:hypothetical protein
MDNGNVKLVASRFLLPLEFYLGVTAIAWALSGGLGKGTLHEALKNNDNTTSWLLMLSAVGFAQCGAAAAEWLNGREWDLDKVWRAARFRTAVAFISMLTWGWVIKMMLDTGTWETVFVLIMVAPTTFALQGWVWWELPRAPRCGREHSHKHNDLQALKNE